MRRSREPRHLGKAGTGHEQARPPVLVLVQDLRGRIINAAIGEPIRELDIGPARLPATRPPTKTTPNPLRVQGHSDVLRHHTGALGGTRTPNLLIRSQVLYPLSYERWCRNSLRYGRPSPYGLTTSCPVAPETWPSRQATDPGSVQAGRRLMRNRTVRPRLSRERRCGRRAGPGRRRRWGWRFRR